MGCIQNAWVWCKRIRHRRGYGVHSPFAFNLITWVIYEKLPFYAYSELRKKRKEHLKRCKHFLPDKPYRTEKIDTLLFRLVNEIQPSVLLEIGTSSGLSSLYMSSVGQSVRCITLDTVNPVNNFADKLLGNSVNVEFHVGDSIQNLSSILESLRGIDFIHLNYPHANDSTFEMCLTKVHHHTIMVVDGIHASGAMEEWWKKTVNDERVGITFDLYSLGLVFFDKTKIKQHYVVNF